MNIFEIPTGSRVYRTFAMYRVGFVFEVLTHYGEVVELKKEDSRYVRDSAGYVYQLSAEWHATREASLLEAAARIEDGARRLMEQAQELRDKAQAPQD